MDRTKFKNLAERAVWAFCWGFISSFVTLAPGVLAAPNLSSMRALAVATFVGSVAGGLSALKTFVKETM